MGHPSHEYDCECAECQPPAAPCPTCGNSPCECSASVGQDGVTAIDRSKVPWRVWRDVSPHATVEAGVFTWR